MHKQLCEKEWVCFDELYPCELCCYTSVGKNGDSCWVHPQMCRACASACLCLPQWFARCAGWTVHPREMLCPSYRIADQPMYGLVQPRYCLCNMPRVHKACACSADFPALRPVCLHRGRTPLDSPWQLRPQSHVRMHICGRQPPTLDTPISSFFLSLPLFVSCYYCVHCHHYNRHPPMLDTLISLHMLPPLV